MCRVLCFSPVAQDSIQPFTVLASFIVSGIIGEINCYFFYKSLNGVLARDQKNKNNRCYWLHELIFKMKLNWFLHTMQVVFMEIPEEANMMECSTIYEPAHEIFVLTGNQRRLRRVCASAQSRQSLFCSHTYSMEVKEGADRKSDI